MTEKDAEFYKEQIKKYEALKAKSENQERITDIIAMYKEELAKLKKGKDLTDWQ